MILSHLPLPFFLGGGGLKGQEEVCRWQWKQDSRWAARYFSSWQVEASRAKTELDKVCFTFPMFGALRCSGES